MNDFTLHKLFEAPQSIEPTEFGLDVPSSNIAFTKKLLQKKKTLIRSYGKNRNLYKVGRQFALIDEDKSSLIYYVQWTEINHRAVGHLAASEIRLWRDDIAEMGLKDLTKDVFWDLLFSLYGVMITDTMQTTDGKRFWLRRVAEAFDSSLNVYYINLLPAPGGVPPELTLIQDLDEFSKMAIEKSFWGEPEHFQARKIIISKFDLKDALRKRNAPRA